MASMVRTVDVTGSKSIGIPTKTVKMSLHPQPHCATATGFHDNMSIVPERYDHEVFKKMSFENSNSKFVTATGAA